MMISPNCYIEDQKDKSYKQLLKEREELLKAIYSFENEEIEQGEMFYSPSPEVVYQMNLEYLGELCKLISKKYNEEYIWGK